MSEIKNGGLDQYGAEPFEQQQFGTAGVEGVKMFFSFIKRVLKFFSILVMNVFYMRGWNQLCDNYLTWLNILSATAATRWTIGCATPLHAGNPSILFVVDFKDKQSKGG